MISTMMDLIEPKKKKHVHVQSQPALPLIANGNGEWRIFTAHLSASGTCIVDPIEMEALYSMGFFGKGSLSKSYPSFGKRRFGAPPIIRERQWNRRKQWLEELGKLNQDSNFNENNDLEIVLGHGNNCFPSIEMRTEEIYDEKKEESCNGKAVDVDFKVMADEEPLEVQENVEKTSTKKIVDVVNSEKFDELIPKSPVKVNYIKQNVSIEFITDKSSVSRARIENSVESNVKKNDKKYNKDMENTDESVEQNCEEGEILDKNHEDHDGGIEDLKEMNEIPSPVMCSENANVYEVVLDSTEDEEIYEIVKKKSNNITESSPMLDDISILDDQLLANKFHHHNDGNIKEEVNPYELLILPDTDSETENYLKNVKTRIENGGFPVNETLHLTFEETFFLMYGLGCLQLVHYDGSIFSIGDAWIHFQQQDKYFIQKYVVYHYFRSKGWIVKSGLKFGGDFLLYKQGPPFYHASYIVIIEVIDADTLIRDDMKSIRKLTWKNLIGMERLSETISKEILFAQILWPSSILQNGNWMPVEGLLEFTVRELLWRRWNPKRKCDVFVDEEDSDSS